jgi:hypothetical protein
MTSDDEKEIERRRDDAVRRALNTPPQPKTAKDKKANRESSAPKSDAKPRGR